MEIHPLRVAEALSQRGIPLLYALRQGTAAQGHAVGRRFAPVFLPFRWYIHPRSFLPLRRIVRTFGIDVVHVHTTRDAWQGLLLAGVVRRRTVLVLSRHMASPEGSTKTDPLHRWLARRVDAVVAVSDYIRENILSVYPIPAGKVHVIPYGLGEEAAGDAHSVRPIRESLRVPEDGFLVGMVAQVTPDKRQDLFIRAARLVLEAWPQCRFVMAGATVQAWYEAEIRRMISAWHLEDRVLVAGFRRDIPDLMRSLDVLVHPAKAEAFGLVLLEAMANGCPIVASASGAVPEIVRHDLNGLLFPPGDAEALAGALIQLLASPEKRKRLGRAGNDLFRARYVLEREAEATERLYRSLLGSSSSR